MRKAKFYLIVSVLVFNGMVMSAQDSDHVADAHHDGSHHKITLVMANSIIKNSFEEQGNSIRLVPTFGFNYDYFFNGRWGIGLHTDILLQQYKVEVHNNHEELIRENPVAICGMLLFKPHHKWVLMAGYGIEAEKNHSFQMIRMGVEYAIELPKHWELGFSLEFDYKIKTQNSLMFGLGFSRLF